MVDIDNKQIVKWLAKHPFLEEVASLPLAIEGALKDGKALDKLELDNVEEEFAFLLEEGRFLLDGSFELGVADCSVALFNRLITVSKEESLPEAIRKEIEKLSLILDKAGLVQASILKNQDAINTIALSANMDANLLSYLSWQVIAKALENIVLQVQAWSLTHRTGAHCPICNSEAGVAILRESKRGRERFLCCNHCGLEWSYARMGCPYCENIDQKKLSIKESLEEPDVRLDLCHNCNTYIKTYIGSEPDNIGKRDYLSFHMDYLMKDEGFAKRGYLLSL